jgi:hypothetical protein
MSKAQDILRLQQIAQLILDVKLAALQTASRKREQSVELLASLNQPGKPTDLPPTAAHLAQLRYQKWADVRRAEINLVLAQQTVDLHFARDAAAAAFGKDQALRGVQAKLA